jgi:hypothetical protein
MKKVSPRRFCNVLLASIALLSATSTAFALNETTPSQGGPGEVVQDNSGNMFMEEVVDLDKWNEEEAQRKKKSTLERPRLTEKQLLDNGFQMTPSGNLVPLINRGAPAIQQQGTRFTQSYEPAYSNIVVSPTPSFNPYLPSIYTEPSFSNPFMMGMMGGYGMGYPGMGFGFGGMGMGYGGMGFGGMGFGGMGMGYGGYGFGSALGGLLNAYNPFRHSWGNSGYGGYGGFGGYGYGGYGMPYGNPLLGMPYSAPTIIQLPSYSYTWESTPGAPNPTPSTFSTSGSVLQRPFWSGYAGSGPLGGFHAGGSVSLPTINEYQSDTTFTPIPPSGPRNPAN